MPFTKTPSLFWFFLNLVCCDFIRKKLKYLVVRCCYSGQHVVYTSVQASEHGPSRAQHEFFRRGALSPGPLAAGALQLGGSPLRGQPLPVPRPLPEPAPSQPLSPSCLFIEILFQDLSFILSVYIYSSCLCFMNAVFAYLRKCYLVFLKSLFLFPSFSLMISSKFIVSISRFVLFCFPVRLLVLLDHPVILRPEACDPALRSAWWGSGTEQHPSPAPDGRPLLVSHWGAGDRGIPEQRDFSTPHALLVVPGFSCSERLLFIFSTE